MNETEFNELRDNDFSLLLIEEGGKWALRIQYVIFSPERKVHERYFMSYRNNIRHWKILDNAIAFIHSNTRNNKLREYKSLNVQFEDGLFLTTVRK